MRDMSKVWSLPCSDMEKLAAFVWRMALIFFGAKIVLSTIASILYIYASTEPGMQAHKFTAFGASVGELSTVATLILQLLAFRFVLEVGLHLVGERKPMLALPNEPLTP